MDWVWWSRALRNPRISSASRRSALPTNKGFAERSWREFGSAFFGRARGERQSNIAVAAAPSEVNGEDLNLHAFRHTPSNVCVCHSPPERARQFDQERREQERREDRWPNSEPESRFP